MKTFLNKYVVRSSDNQSVLVTSVDYHNQLNADFLPIDDNRIPLIFNSQKEALNYMTEIYGEHFAKVCVMYIRYEIEMR